MNFQQRQLTRTTLLVLREHGLYVSQQDARSQLDIVVEIPYEEMLPLRLEYQTSVPGQLWPAGALALLLWLGWLVHPWLAGEPMPQLSNTWFQLVEMGVGIGAAVYYMWHNWWHQAVLHTSHMRLVLGDHRRDRQALKNFVQLAQEQAKNYLRREYAPINPLGIIEPQLRRLAWLHELDVLSTAEAQALATRLTGRLPGRGLRSMGQKLDAPYVN